MLNLIRSRLPDKSQKQAQEELDSARVQAIERAPIGRHFVQTLPLHSISLLFIGLDPMED